MPGRTPAEAVSAFLAPIQQAASALGAVKVTGKGGYRSPRLGDEYSWGLCSGAGVDVGKGMTFFAAMSWRLIEDDRDGYGPYRVTTTRYDYSLTDDSGAEYWAHHWHPDGKSAVTGPHVHLGPLVLDGASPVTSKAHLPTGRMTFESAVRWVVESGGKHVSNWEELLDLAEVPHLLYRSWTQDRESETTAE